MLNVNETEGRLLIWDQALTLAVSWSVVVAPFLKKANSTAGGYYFIRDLLNLLSVLVLRLVTCLLSSDHKLKIWSTGLQIWAVCGSDIMFILGHVLPCLSETIKSNQIYLLLFPQRESRATSSCFSWWTPTHPQVRGDIIWVCGFYPLQCYPEQASPIPAEGHCWLKPGGHWRTSEGWWFTCHRTFILALCFALFLITFFTVFLFSHYTTQTLWE